MFVQMYCENRSQKDKDEIYEVLGLLCRREEIQIEDKGDSVEITVCPQGKIVVTEEDDQVILSANTRHAGAGFHAFVVEFFLDIQEEIEGKYELNDDLSYDGDFNRLCEIYEDEIVYLKDVLLNNDLVQSQNYMYDETFFLPLNDHRSIITSIGKLDKEEFKIMDPKALLSYFYVWNEWDKDAQFFKNAALLTLAKEGAGKYTNMNETTIKFANLICDYIELAYENDPMISLPMKEYNSICALLERKNKLENAKQMEEEVIQYRTKEVFHLFEDVKVVAHGMAERSYDPTNQSLCLMAPYLDDESWDWLIQASKESDICVHKNELLDKKPIVYRNKEMYVETYKEDGYIVIEAIVVQGDRTLYFHCTIANEKNIPYITQCIKESEFQQGIEE